MLNKIILQGRLTRDPEKRYTPSGTVVAKFSLAVERDYKDQGNNQRTTDFVEVVAWRASADFVSKYFTKGQMAVVEGRLQMRDWTDKNGGKRRSAEVVAENIYFCGSKPAARSEGNADKRDLPAAQEQRYQDLSGEDEELPF